MKLINQKYNKVFIIFIKILVVALSFWVLYSEITKGVLKLNFDELRIQIFDRVNIWLMILVLLLGVVNIFFDIYKWYLAINVVEPISFKSAVNAVFTGMSIGLLTPNSIGEFVGRILHLKNINKLKGTIIYFIVSLSQMSITIMVACICSLYYFYFVEPLSTFYYGMVMILSVSIFLITMLFVFKLDSIFEVFNKIKFLKNKVKVLEVYKEYNKKDLSNFLLLSLLKFITFSFQYIIVYRILGYDGSNILLFSVLSMIFISQSLLPVFSLFEIGIKGSLAILFLKPIGINVSVILMATFSIWMLNVILPSIIGLFLFVNSKIAK